MRGVDCSQPISGQALADADIDFVFRYLSTFANPKDDGQAEIADHHAHGIAEGLVFEDGIYSVSPSQARAAVDHAQALGAPTNSTVAVFMACDMNPAPSSALSDMIESANILRAAGFLAGWYGNKETARQLQGGGHIDAAWVVDTWGQDTPTDRWNFRQLPNSPNLIIGGVNCDQDDAPFPVGLWTGAPTPAPAPVPIPLPPVQTYPGDNMTREPLSITLDGNGNGYSDMAVPFARICAQPLVNGADPATNHAYSPIPKVAALEVGAGTRVVVEGGPPSGQILVFVPVAS